MNTTTQTLLPIATQTLNDQLIQTVDARKLHEFLEVGKVFGAWIVERIKQYGFVENQDFVCFPVSESKGRGGHNRKDYHLTITMAKELAMVERNDKGRVSACIHNNGRVDLKMELQNLLNRRRSSAPDSLGGFFAPAFLRGNHRVPTFAKLRGSHVHVQAARPKAWLPNLRWDFEPPGLGRFKIVHAPAIFIASEGAQL